MRKTIQYTINIILFGVAIMVLSAMISFGWEIGIQLAWQ